MSPVSLIAAAIRVISALLWAELDAQQDSHDNCTAKEQLFKNNFRLYHKNQRTTEFVA